MERSSRASRPALVVDPAPRHGAATGGTARRSGAGVRPELWLPVAYAVLSAIWIGFSDVIVARAAHTAHQHALYSIVKGFGFVGVTAVLLHAGVRWSLARQRRAHRHLSTIVQASLDGFWVIDEGGRLLDVNDSYCAMTGFARHELLAMTIGDVDVRETDEEAAAHLGRVVRQGSDRFEARHRCRDGRVLDVEASVTFVPRSRTFVAFFRDITDRKRGEEALRRSEERFRALIERSTDLILVVDGDGRYRFWSQGAAEALGWAADAVLGHPALETVHHEDRPRISRFWARLRSQPGRAFQETVRLRHQDGAWREVELTARNLLADAAVAGVVVNGRDVTEQRLLEQQFRQAQKLESIGRLAGGVAHDFNNLLTVILSCADDIAEGGADTATCRQYAEEIRAAGRRAGELTRQLLAFARKQVIAPVPLDLNELVRGTEKLLRRLLGEDIRLVTRLAPDLWNVCCDPSQLEQVVMNLAVNARDAMPRGGTLAIETHNAVVTAEEAARLADARPGTWVRLVVHDTGSGMPEEVQGHLFEPFFTTKRQGDGTGLGLATVHGIIGQAGGHIHVESAVGRGTTFRICLPPTQHAPARAATPEARAARGSETLLVIEDDPQVRRVTVRTLEGAGYRVLGAASGDEALDRARRHDERIDLVVTDVVMPGLSGRGLVRALERVRPGIRVLYVSGYTRDAIANQGVLDEGIQFLPKPFTPATLLERVRRLLGTAGT